LEAVPKGAGRIDFKRNIMKNRRHGLGYLERAGRLRPF
jgi:hypothetical protein